MKIYTAYPNPSNKNAAGGTYNEQSQPYYDCRCGETFIPASGGIRHNCQATKEERLYHGLQNEIARLGQPTDHPNMREVSQAELDTWANTPEKQALVAWIIQETF